jgi:hypothetical protein
LRIETAERLETLDRVNRGLSYRMSGEMADPVDGRDDPALPADVPIPRLLTPAQHCHDAVKLAMRHALSSGALGVHRGVPVTVIVTTKLA